MSISSISIGHNSYCRLRRKPQAKQITLFQELELSAAKETADERSDPAKNAAHEAKNAAEETGEVDVDTEEEVQVQIESL